MSSCPAPDGETLSDEEITRFREALTRGAIVVRHEHILKLCDTVAALRAELADARRLAYRTGWNDATADAALTHTRQAQREWKLEQRYPRAARAASGEDASHD